MKVQLLTSRASTRGAWHEGDVIDIPAKEARKLIKDGSAIPVRRQPVETAERAQ